MGRFLSPLEIIGHVLKEGLSDLGAAAVTIVTTPNDDEYDGALYECSAYVRVNTLDGEAVAAVPLQIKLIVTEGASARTLVVPLVNEAGTVAVSYDISTTSGAVGLVRGMPFTFRADKNTAIQYQVDELTSDVADDDGNFDLQIQIKRVA